MEMKKNKYIVLAIVLSFLILALPNISKSVVSSPSHRYHVSYAPILTVVSMPENVTPQFLGCRHTTNPDKDWVNGDPLEELTVNELSWGYNVVLALDEDAVAKWGIDYSVRAVERADESLVAQYYKDLRIREIVTYTSDNSIEWMNPDYAGGQPSLYDEAYNLFKNKFNEGTSIIIVVTGQETQDSYIAGLAPDFSIVGSNTMIMVRFQVYFVDDNLVQHEVSHCFGCLDHDETVDVWCVMAYKEELLYIDWVEEDGNWFGPYNSYVSRSYLFYHYCESCDVILKGSSGHGFGGNPMRLWPVPL